MTAFVVFELGNIGHAFSNFWLCLLLHFSDFDCNTCLCKLGYVCMLYECSMNAYECLWMLMVANSIFYANRFMPTEVFIRVQNNPNA